MTPESIFPATQACTPAWSCCREKYPCSKARILPTSQVAKATARDVSGSYKQAFFLSNVFKTSDGDRGLPEALGPDGLGPLLLCVAGDGRCAFWVVCPLGALPVLGGV